MLHFTLDEEIQACSIILPFINALLTETVCAGQYKVGLSVHADTALLLISQLLHSAWKHKQERVKYELILKRRKLPFCFSKWWNEMLVVR